MQTAAIERLRDLLTPVLDRAGLALWDVEAERSVLRISVEAGGGVDLDVLAAASAAVSGVVDVHPELTPDGAYQLEVSSPGLERSLRRPAHYRRYVGTPVTVKTTEAVDGQRRWQGDLAGVDDDGIELLVGEGADVARTVAFRFSQIDRARTVMVWGPAPKPGRAPVRHPTPAARTLPPEPLPPKPLPPKPPGGTSRRADPKSPAGGAAPGAEVKDTA